MQFSFPQLSLWRDRLAPTLQTILGISWWFILGLLFAMLFLNGLFFYLYGLGYAEPAAALEGPSVLRVHEESIRNAANLVGKAREAIEAPPENLSGSSDPFR